MDSDDRRREVAHSQDDFIDIVRLYSLEDMKLSDIDRLTRRPHAGRRVKTDGDDRTNAIGLRGSTATLDDVAFLRPIYAGMDTSNASGATDIQLEPLFEASFISTGSLQMAYEELGLCKVNINTGQFKLSTGDTAEPVSSSASRLYSMDMDKPITTPTAPVKIGTRPVESPKESRAAITKWRDLDDFIHVLGNRSKPGTSPMFQRRMPGAFFTSAKIYESYKLAHTSSTNVESDDDELDDLLSLYNKSPTRGLDNATDADADEEAYPRDSWGRLRRPDEERVTNFVTPWWNALSAYHVSTRALCTLVPDRANFTIVSARDQDEAGATLTAGINRSDAPAGYYNLLNARVDGLVPKKHTAFPLTNKLSASSVLLTLEFKPPINGVDYPHMTILSQLTCQIVARIASLHDPRKKGSLPTTFSGSKSILAATVCGFECAIFVATYTEEWLQYILSSKSKVWRKGLGSCDFLWIRRVFRTDMLRKNQEVHLLNAIILGIFIEEYAEKSDPFVASSRASASQLMTPVRPAVTNMPYRTRTSERSPTFRSGGERMQSGAGGQDARARVSEREERRAPQDLPIAAARIGRSGPSSSGTAGSKSSGAEEMRASGKTESPSSSMMKTRSASKAESSHIAADRKSSSTKPESSSSRRSGVDDKKKKS